MAHVPHGCWKTLTFVTALRCDGIAAPCVFNQPIGAVSFLASVTQFPVPILRRDKMVVIDSLSSHKNLVLRRARPGRAAAVLAALQPRPEPNRAGVLQAENLASEGGRAHPEEAEQGIGGLLKLVSPSGCATDFREANDAT